MRANYLSMFFDRMKFKICTGEITGIRDFRISVLQFRMDPSIDSDTAYKLFDYMSNLSQCVEPNASIAINAAAWMSENRIPFRTRFLWDRNLTFLGNVKSWFWVRRLHKFLHTMQTEPGRWIAACEQMVTERYGVA